MFRKYPSLTLLGTVIGGIIVADLIHPPLSLLVSGALLFVIGGYLCYRYSRASIGAILFALSLAAIAAVQFAHATYQLPPSHYSKAADPRQTVQIYGKVADWPELKTERTELIISVDSLGGKVAQRATGRLLLKISDTTTALQRGDRVEFYGRIYHIEETPGSERFDYGRYLNLKGIFGTVYLPSVLDIRVNRRADLSFFAIVDRLRDHIRRVLQSNLSPETAALASGFLIGETRDIPVEVYRMFRDSGTLHLMAVSGSNVAVVLGFFYLLLKPFPLGRVQRSIALLLVVVVFAALSYGDPSVMRASVMAALVIMARLIQRRFNLNNIIALAMLVILVVDPGELYNVGFQLSFVTAWGLIFIVPKVMVIFTSYQNRWWYRWIAFPLIISGVAQICSTPLIAYYFERVPLVSVAANLVIVPLASVALVGILTMLIAHMILPIAGMLVGGLLDAVLLLTLKAVTFFGGSGLPNLAVKLSLSPIWAGMAIVALLGLIAIAAMAISSKPARRWLLALILILLNSSLVAVAVQASQKETGSIHLITIPGGVAALLQSVGAKPDLIITGLIDKPYQLEEKILLPWLRDHQVTRLRRCFVLSAGYHALDDLLRLVDGSDIEQLHMANSTENGMRQVCANLQVEDQISRRIRYFGGVAQSATVGYALSQNQIDLIQPGGTITFVSSSERLNVRNSFPGLPTVVVFGRTWKADPEDWIALHESGIDQIICPKLAQLRTVAPSDPHEANDLAVPVYLHQLSRLGELKIDLARPLSIRPR